MTVQDEKYKECGRKVSFECQHCGRCCTDFFVPIGAEDLRKLQEKAGSMNGKIVTADAVNPLTGKEVSTPSLVRPCPFHDGSRGRCSIYAHRPRTCVIFPFFARKENGGIRYFCSGICPGVGRGAKVDLHDLGLHKLCKALDDDIAALKSAAGKK